MSNITTLTDIQRVVTEDQYKNDIEEANQISIALGKQLLKAKQKSVKDTLYIQMLTEKHKEALKQVRILEDQLKSHKIEIQKPKADNSIIKNLINDLAKDPDISEDVLKQYHEINLREYEKTFG